MGGIIWEDRNHSVIANTIVTFEQPMRQTSIVPTPLTHRDEIVAPNTRLNFALQVSSRMLPPLERSLGKHER